MLGCHPAMVLFSVGSNELVKGNTKERKQEKMKRFMTILASAAVAVLSFAALAATQKVTVDASRVPGDCKSGKG